MGGVSIDDGVFASEERTSHEVLDPGTYTLTARAEGHAPESQIIVVRAGETTRVRVLLQKQ